MEALAEKVKNILGVHLDPDELKRLTARFTNTHGFDEKAFISSLNNIVHKYTVNENNPLIKVKDKSFSETNSTKYINKGIETAYVECKSNNFDSVIKDIHRAIVQRSVYIKGNGMVRKAYLLLCNSRSSTLTKQQLIETCLYSLFLKLSLEQIDVIFNRLDKKNEGKLLVRDLIEVIFAGDTSVTGDFSSIMDTNIQRQIDIKSTFSDLVINENAKIGYDSKIVGLSEPPNDLIITVNIDDLFLLIYQKLMEKSIPGQTLVQTIFRLFCDSHRSSDDIGGVSMDQVKFTLWKRLNILVPAALIQQIFEKYDFNNSGFIPFHVLVDLILKRNSRSEGLIPDIASISSDYKRLSVNKEVTFDYSETIMHFLIFMRRKIRDIINQESRAPHLLLHGTDRMNKEQARRFFEKKFNIIVGDPLLNELMTVFNRFGLIDIKRIIQDAMSLSAEGIFGKDLSLLSGNAVMVDNLPASLNKNKKSISQINKVFKDKLELRFSNGTPMSTLHRVFRDVTDGNNNRFVTKPGLRNILRKFDILLTDEELDSYYIFHLGDDEKLSSRKMILSLFPSVNPDENPFSPKSDAAVRNEKMLAEALADYTRTSRKVSMLNGPAFTRLGSHNFNNDINIAPRQSSSRTEDIEHYLNIGNYAMETPSNYNVVDNKVTNSKVGTDFKDFDYDYMIKLLQEAKNREIIGTTADAKNYIPEDSNVFAQNHINGNASENLTVGTAEDADVPVENNSRHTGNRPKSAGARSQTIDHSTNRPRSANTKFPSKVLSSRCFTKNEKVTNVHVKSKSTIKDDDISHHDALLDTYAVRSFLQRPNTSGSTRSSVKSPRIKIFANSGQNWIVPVNPVSDSLRQKYQVEKRGQILSSHEYGLFVKSLTKAEQYRKNLRKQFDESKRLLTGVGSRIDTPRRPTTSGASKNSPRKVNCK